MSGAGFRVVIFGWGDGEEDVIEDVQVWNEVEHLEDESDVS